MGLSVTDPEGRFLDFNSRLCDLVGLAGEALRRSDERSLTHPEDRAAEDALLEDLLAGRRPAYVVEKRYRRRNGSIVWVRISAAAVGRSRIMRVVEDVSDAVTAFREAERFHQEAVGTRRLLEVRLKQQEALARVGADALLGVEETHLLSNTCRMLADLLDVSNTKILQLTPKKDAVVLRAGVGWQEGLMGDRVSIGPDSQAGYTLIAGHPVVVRDLRTESRFSGPPLLHDHGIVSGMSVIIHGSTGPWGVLGVHDREEHVFTQDDVRFLQSVSHMLGLAVQRQAAEERIRLANETLEETVRERTRELQDAYDSLETFSYTVAHDLRSPLGAMRQLARVAASTADAETKESLASVEEEASKMVRLVENLLDFAHASQAEPARTTIDIAALAWQVAEEKRRETGKDVTFIGPDEPVRVEADRDLVLIVLENLIGNAWKFTSGSPSPTVEFAHEPGPPPRFFVRDNGVGFEPAQANELFAPFRRLHRGRFPGTGVGLATVRRIVERHGGQVDATARPGEGAKFSFTLGDGP